MLNFFKLIFILLALVSEVANGNPASPPVQPLVKINSCPSGYYGSGSYCVPGNNAKFAIVRNGTCPSGYHGSGNYCVSNK